MHHTLFSAAVAVVATITMTAVAAAKDEYTCKISVMAAQVPSGKEYTVLSDGLDPATMTVDVPVPGPSPTEAVNYARKNKPGRVAAQTEYERTHVIRQGYWAVTHKGSYIVLSCR